MPTDPSQLSIEELGIIAADLSGSLASSSNKLAPLLRFHISLLELFKYESKRYDALGYCDFSIAYVAHSANLLLARSSVKYATHDTKPLLTQVLTQLKNNEPKYLIMKENLASKRLAETATPDPLALRFANLKLGLSEPSSSVFDGFRYSDSISVYELNHLIRSNPIDVLLIDFRSQKEFNYSHINFLSVVNVLPSVVAATYAKHKNPCDTDLVDELKGTLSTKDLDMLSNRQKYRLIVVYNLRFGTIATDKFKSLEYLLLKNDSKDIPSSNPFQQLLHLIMFETKYLSSRPQQFPVYLNGGMERWYSAFGEGSLTRQLPSSSPSLSIRQNIDSTATSITPQKKSQYLTSFGDYFASAKTTPPNDPRPTLPSDSAYSSSSHRLSINVHEFAPVRTSSTPSSANNYAKLFLNGSLVSSVSVPREDRSSEKLPSKKPENPPVYSSQKPSLKEPAPKPKPQPQPTSPAPSNNFLGNFTTGLTNLGNSCYMNCVLQCLGATPQLTSFFFPTLSSTGDLQKLQSYKQHINTKNRLGTSGVLTTNFVKLLGNMFNNVGKYFAPHDFKKIMGNFASAEHFASFDQQDCIEFLNFILDSLHEDLNQRVIENAEERSAIMNLTPEQEQTREVLPVRLASTIEWERYLKLNFSIIVDYFQGQYLSQLKCLECGMTSTTYNAFSILSLPIPEKLNSSSKVTLAQCLDLFTDTELLDDDNKWHCPKCQKFTRLTKKITITRLPRVLIIHFKRFLMLMTGQFSKLDTFIHFPVTETLDLTSYWPQVGTFATPGNATMDVAQEQKLLESFPQRNQNPPFKYKLYGVVNHFGNLTTGHYTAYVKKSSDIKKRKEWCYFDDAKVTLDCKPEQVMNKNAYCLFFQRV